MNDDLARLVAQQRRAFSTISSPGYLDGGVLGVALDFQPEGWIFLEVLESPGTASFTGYSWEQRVPRPDGSWAAPDATLGIVLSGNNGGTGATRRNPAFVLGGGVVAVGATAYAVRGYQDGAETSGGTGQEWLILGLVSESAAIAHVVGRPRAVDGRRWYDARLSLTDSGTYVRSDGASVWLLQVKDAELATDGPGYYDAVGRGFSAAIAGETRSVYETAERLRLIDVACNTDTGAIDRAAEGTFGGDLPGGTLPGGDLDFSMVRNSALFPVIFN